MRSSTSGRRTGRPTRTTTEVARALVALPAEPAVLLPALAAALAGTGPAVLPVAPEDPRGLSAAMRTELGVDDEVAVVVPTSGSTGAPKGVLLSAAALTASAAASAERLGGRGRWLLTLAPTTVAGLGVLVRSLVAGTDPEVSFGADPAAFTDAARRLGGGRAYVSLVPTQLRRLLDGAAPALAGFDAVLLGGAAADPALLERAAVAGVRVVTSYGMAETCGGCVYDGRPLSGIGAELDAGGVVVLSGPTVALGYRLREDASFSTAAGGRRFRTRDLGRFAADGRLEVFGRADDMIVTGGVNVAPTAVEAALLTHPGVAEAAVVGVPDATWGQRVVAVVVVACGAGPPSLGLLREHVATRLPRSWCPRELRLVAAMPLLPGGKIDRAALRS